MGLIGLIFGTKRASIGGVTVDATVKETHRLTSVCTENPVETGETITDHVNLKPFELEIEGIITDTPVNFSIVDSITGLVETVSTLMGNKSRSLEKYDELSKMFKDRKPFKVVTGLKAYDNMICEDFTITRESKTGKAISFTAKFKQITFVSAKTIGGSSSYNIPLAQSVGEPAKTVSDIASKTADKGTQILRKAQDGLPFASTPFGSAIETGSQALFTIFAGIGF